MKRIELIFLSLILFTGCFNYQELNDLAIVTSMAIDKIDNEYEVTILISNHKNDILNIYSGQGTTILEAYKDIELKSSQKIYIGHLSSIIISEEIARDGINKISDMFLREPSASKNFQIAIAKDCKAKDIIKILAPLEQSHSQILYNNMKASSQTQSIAKNVTLSDFIQKVLKKGINPTAPSITIQKNDLTNQQIKLETTAIFKN